jgi:hypothetical protein
MDLSLAGAFVSQSRAPPGRSLGLLSFGGLLDRLIGGGEFPEPRPYGSVDHTPPGRVADRRCDERQRFRVRMPHVVGRRGIVSAREQCAGAIKERLPACYGELVADMPEEAPCPARWFDLQNDRLRMQCVSGAVRRIAGRSSWWDTAGKKRSLSLG